MTNYLEDWEKDSIYARKLVTTTVITSVVAINFVFLSIAYLLLC